MFRTTLFAGFVALAAAATALSGCNDDSTSTTTAAGGKLVITSEDRTLGDPKAPIQIVEYAAPMCPHCAHFNETVIPMLKSDYIDKGKVFYVFRVFPIGQADIPAESLARCFPKEGYFPFIDLLFKHQDVWDPENGVANVQAGLVEVASSAGMSQDKAIACLQNPKEAARVNKNSQEAVKNFNLNSTPSFVVNGKLHDGGFDQDSLKKFLDALLSQK